MDWMKERTAHPLYPIDATSTKTLPERRLNL